MHFEFAAPSRILFGPGLLDEAARRAARMGRNALVVTGRNGERATPLLEQLREQGTAFVTFSVAGEPTTTIAMAGAEVGRRASCDLVVAMGGGSVIDAGKAIAALLTNPGDVLDYLEVIGQGRELKKRPAPFVAIPTTSGTGAEVTKNAVLASTEHKVKVSMRSPWLLARLAVVDPTLTLSMPPAVTASTGLDALTQLLEAFVSNAANPMTDGFCREGLLRAGRSLMRAYDDGSDEAAREDMSLASLLSGLALGNAKLGAVHGFAGVLGGLLGAPHGVVCARLLPPVMEANLRALQERAPSSPAPQRYDEAAKILTGDAAATASDGVAWVQDLCTHMRIPLLAECGLSEAIIPEVVEQAMRSSSLKGNPIALTAEELGVILRARES